MCVSSCRTVVGATDHEGLEDAVVACVWEVHEPRPSEIRYVEL